MRHLGLWVVLLPRNFALGILLVYRTVISPLYGNVCRYYPSCSLYALRAIQYHGVLWGISLGLLRLLRCNPWTKGGIDDPPESLRGSYEIGRRGFVRVKGR